MLIQQRVCDLCDMDGKELVPAKRFYVPEDGNRYDVCEKHRRDAEKAGWATYGIPEAEK